MYHWIPPDTILASDLIVSPPLAPESCKLYFPARTHDLLWLILTTDLVCLRGGGLCSGFPRIHWLTLYWRQITIPKSPPDLPKSANVFLNVHFLRMTRARGGSRYRGEKGTGMNSQCGCWISMGFQMHRICPIVHHMMCFCCPLPWSVAGAISSLLWPSKVV